MSERTCASIAGRIGGFLVAAAAVTALLAGCGGSTAASTKIADTQSGTWGAVLRPAGTPKRGGTLRVDQLQAPEGISSLHYVLSSDNQIGQVVQQIFDQLLEFQPGSLAPKAGLADRWEVSPDAKTYTFHLRDAKFSNGMPVTSADVKYSLDFAKRPDSLYVDLYKVISTIDTPDSKTVVIHLSAPSRAFLYYVAYIASSIVPEKLVKSEGVNAFNNHPIGSGPFMLKRWVRNQEIDLVRNPTYWRTGLPYVNAVRLLATPNDSTRSLDVQSGTVDIADSVPFSQIRTINAGTKAKVLIAPGADMNVVWLNNSKKPLDEVTVRRALAYATPVDSIVKVVFAGLAPRMNTIIPKLKYWTSAARAYAYDLAKAKQELAQSSVPHGFSLSIEIVTGGADQASQQTAEILRDSWAKIGVHLKIKPVDGATQGDDFGSGHYEALLIAPGAVTSDVPVDDEFAQLVFDSPSTHNLYTFSHDPTLARLVQQAVVEPNESKRVVLFREMHIRSMQDVPVIPMVYTPNRAAVASNVHNFNYLLGGLWRLETVWLG